MALPPRVLSLPIRAAAAAALAGIPTSRDVRLLTIRRETPRVLLVAPYSDIELAPRSAQVPRGAYLALPLLVLAPALVFITLRRFDGLYGQDSFAYYDYALGPLRNALVHGTAWPTFFWPPGFPLLVALASFAIGNVAGQVVSMAMGALVPLLPALVVRDLQPRQRWLPLLAGALVALCGQMWQSSMVLMADTTGLAMALLAAWAVARYGRQPHVAWLLLASAAIVLALLSRWIYGLVAVPLA